MVLIVISKLGVEKIAKLRVPSLGLNMMKSDLIIKWVNLQFILNEN